MLSSSHLTSCTPTKSDLHLANSLVTVVSEPNLYWLLTFQVSNLMSLFHCFGRTEVSGQFRGMYSCFVTKPVFTVRSCQHLPQTPSWRTTHFRLSAIAYSVYLHLASILVDVPPSATWGRAMPRWQVRSATQLHIPVRSGHRISVHITLCSGPYIRFLKCKHKSVLSGCIYPF